VTPEEIENIFAPVHANSPSGTHLEIPPKVFRDMHGELLEYVKNRSLKAGFPMFERYAGPTGMTQGGIIAAAFDNVFGPLSYLVAKKPCATLTMEITYLRPVSASHEHLIVDAVVKGKSRHVLFMEAQATNKRGKIVATATTALMILQNPMRPAEL
jgi:uncharacterized protein (TIGR00369 family)